MARVKNETHLIILGSQAKNLRSFFSGDYQVKQTRVSDGGTPAEMIPTTPNAQDPLNAALLTDCDTIQTGVADIDLIMGYTCWEKEYGNISLNLGATFPTGNHAKGKHVLEAILGNGHHYGLGMGLDFWLRLCGNYEHNIKLFFKTNYRYLFSSTEHRTVGLKDRNWGQYHLLGSILHEENDRAIPAANVLTRKVEVTPGNQVDLIAGFGYNNSNFSFDIGYNLYFREQEAVMLKSCFPSNTYGVLARHHNFDEQEAPVPNQTRPGRFTGNKLQTDKGSALLTADDLDVTAAETPRQMTHKVLAGAGYRFDSMAIPVLFGVGGHAEYAFKNSAFNNWGVFMKAAIKF